MYALIFLIGIINLLITPLELSETNKSIPEWVLEDWAHRTQFEGVWIADNSDYKSDQEPYDAYGIQWSYGLGNQSLVGRLFVIKDNEEVADAWSFLEYWDAETKMLKVMQTGSNGTVGHGTIKKMDNGKMKEQQRFSTTNGDSYSTGHELWYEDGTQHTHSYDIVNGEWHKRRYYKWKLKEVAEAPLPDEYENMAYLIGTWYSSFGNAKARMTFSWGHNKRAIHYQNNYKPSPNRPWIQENEGLITYNGVNDAIEFMTAYSGVGDHLMAYGQFEILEDGTFLRLFSCHYKEGDGLPWSDGAKAPHGGKTLEFKQVWTPIDEHSFEGNFYWKKDGEWSHPMKNEDHGGRQEIWKRE